MYASTGSARSTTVNAGCGLPRQKFESVQMALRISESRDMSVKLSSSSVIASNEST